MWEYMLVIVLFLASVICSLLFLLFSSGLFLPSVICSIAFLLLFLFGIKLYKVGDKKRLFDIKESICDEMFIKSTRHTENKVFIEPTDTKGSIKTGSNGFTEDGVFIESTVIKGFKLKFGDKVNNVEDVDKGTTYHGIFFLEPYKYEWMEYSSRIGTERGYIFVKEGKLVKIRDDRLKMVFNKDNMFEINCFRGLDPTYKIDSHPYFFDQKKLNNVISDINNKIINTSRVLCLFKLMYHKYIFIDVNFIFELIQTLLSENLVNESN